ncbi:MAG: hypothetical protein ACRD0C_03355 [Acidimicrobiia bacterium]
MDKELDRREARLAAARRKLAELTAGPAEPELLAEIERAHQRVEGLEKKVRGKMSTLAVRARQQLNAAQAVERELLAAHGFDSWLGYQLRRVEHLLYQPSPEEVAAAELEHQRALASWRDLAALMEAEAAEAATAERVEADRRPSTITAWPTAWSALPT